MHGDLTFLISHRSKKKRKVATARPTSPPIVPCSSCSGSGFLRRLPIPNAHRYACTVKSVNVGLRGAAQMRSSLVYEALVEDN
jgi:hypothetical protein